MKRALAETIGFAFGGLLIAVTLYWASDKLCPVYGATKLRMAKLQQYANEIEAINVGNSLNRAVDYDAMKLRGFHLWMFGSDMFEVRYLLNAVVPMLPNLKVVFINVTPLCFIHDNGIAERRHGIRREYYATTPTLRSWRLIKGDLKNLVEGKLSPIVREDHWRGVAESIAVKSHRADQAPRENEEEVFNQVSEDGYIGPLIEVIIKPDTLTRHDRALLINIRASKKIYQRYPQLPEEVYGAMVSIAKMLHERNVRAIFFTSPQTEKANASYAKKAARIVMLTKQYMQRLENEFGAEYYDFSHDPAFTQKYEYFFNYDHLNRYGAQVFSKKLEEICEFSKIAKM